MPELLLVRLGKPCVRVSGGVDPLKTFRRRAQQLDEGRFCPGIGQEELCPAAGPVDRTLDRGGIFRPAGCNNIIRVGFQGGCDIGLDLRRPFIELLKGGDVDAIFGCKEPGPVIEGLAVSVVYGKERDALCAFSFQDREDDFDLGRVALRGPPDIPGLPECPQDVLRLADFVGSTSAIIDWCKKSSAEEFIIMTESGVRFSLERDSPGKKFYFVANEQCNCSECPYMKMNTLEKLRDALRDLQPRVEIPTDIIARARIPIEKMLAVK